MPGPPDMGIPVAIEDPTETPIVVPPQPEPEPDPTVPHPVEPDSVREAQNESE